MGVDSLGHCFATMSWEDFEDPRLNSRTRELLDDAGIQPDTKQWTVVDTILKQFSAKNGGPLKLGLEAKFGKTMCGAIAMTLMAHGYETNDEATSKGARVLWITYSNRLKAEIDSKFVELELKDRGCKVLLIGNLTSTLRKNPDYLKQFSFAFLDEPRAMRGFNSAELDKVLTSFGPHCALMDATEVAVDANQVSQLRWTTPVSVHPYVDGKAAITRVFELMCSWAADPSFKPSAAHKLRVFLVIGKKNAENAEIRKRMIKEGIADLMHRFNWSPPGGSLGLTASSETVSWTVETTGAGVGTNLSFTKLLIAIVTRHEKQSYEEFVAAVYQLVERADRENVGGARVHFVCANPGAQEWLTTALAEQNNLCTAANRTVKESVPTGAADAVETSTATQAD